jgi:glycosyltransferase involved in cell wall biosynthesis
MKVLIALTYYRPHYSGLTIYAERLARALVARGHGVTVLTSRFSKDLARQEKCAGVVVIRPDVWLRISKGVIMPAMLLRAWQLARRADVVNLHVPQLDAAPVAVICRLLRKPIVLTYHCDLLLPKGFIHRLANLVSNLANHISARLADVIVTNSRDYAENSSFLRRYLHKVRPVYPPVELVEPTPEDIAAFREKHGLQPGDLIIGMAARLAAEKGVEYLVQALPEVLEKYPQARVLFVGQHEQVLGEEQYAQKLAPLLQNLGEHWTFLGLVSPVDLAVFFRLADVTVLPSINQTESFGMVQVESMTCGTPVVSTDIPGVRVPVQMTGMGLVVPPRDARALAGAILSILDNPEAYSGSGQGEVERLSSKVVAEEYEKIFSGLAGGQGRQAGVK